MLRTIEIRNADTNDVIATIQTTNVRPRDSVFKYKKRNNIDVPTIWREIETKAVPVKTAIDPRVPSFEDSKVNTRKAYRQHTDNFLKQGGILDNYDSIKAYYDKIPISSKHAFVYAMTHINNDNKTLKDKLKGLQRQSFDEVRILRAERPKEAKITLEQIQSIANRKEYKNNWIAQWYAFGLPWRADTMVHIIKGSQAKASDKRKYNTFYPRKKIIHMEHFKTRDAHGSKDIALTPEQVKIINIGFTLSKSNKRLDITADTLIHRIRDIFGVGINPIRHAHITNARQKMDGDEFRKYCYSLNTSVQCGLEVYNDSN